MALKPCDDVDETTAQTYACRGLGFHRQSTAMYIQRLSGSVNCRCCNMNASTSLHSHCMLLGGAPATEGKERNLVVSHLILYCLNAKLATDTTHGLL